MKLPENSLPRILSRRRLLGCLGVFGCTGVLSAGCMGQVARKCTTKSSLDKPNVVLIMTDDQGQWALGCYGNREIVTPNLDQMARQGVKFLNSYAACPVCSPSRASFMSGLMPSQHGIHDWVRYENEGERARDLIAGFPIFPEVLADHGYVCGQSGKWHLGDNCNPHKGFCYWFSIPTGGSQYNNARVSLNGRVHESEGYLTDLITENALTFIRRNADRPFFANIQYTAPHSPWKGHPQRLLDLYRDCPFDSIPKEPRHPWAATYFDQFGNRETLSQYYASITAVDEGVGRILDELDNLGIRDNTIVFFMSDQGFQCGHNGLFGKGNASNPRNMYEESMKIPTIVQCPSLIPAGSAFGSDGRVLTQCVSAYDFMPTVLHLTGCAMPDQPYRGGRYPGRSYVPLLLNQKLEEPWADAVYGEYGRARMVRTADWKLIHRADGGPDELYCLARDPGEDNNLASDPLYRDEMVQMRKQLFNWFGRYVAGNADPVGMEYLRPDM